jgi:hypothetical protein
LAPKAPGRPSIADELLPPGTSTAAAGAPGPGEQVAIPAAPLPLPHVMGSSGTEAVQLPAADGPLALKDSPKIVGSGDDEVELRRLAPEEKARRRFRKGIILWTLCILVLVAVFYFFTR